MINISILSRGILKIIIFKGFWKGRFPAFLRSNRLKIHIFNEFWIRFEIQIWQQLLLLGYHDVATLQIYYLKSKIDYHFNTIKQITCNLSFDGFWALSSVSYSTFKYHWSKKCWKSTFSKSLKNDYFENPSEQNRDIDQIDTF